jgi:hypothetical protein
MHRSPSIGQTPSRLAKLGPLRKLRIAAAGTAGSLPGVGILVGTKGRWAPTRRAAGACAPDSFSHAARGEISCSIRRRRVRSATSRS